MYRTAPVLAAIGLALVLASCGGGSGSGTGASTDRAGSGASAGRHTTTVPRVGSLTERAGTTAKHKGAHRRHHSRAEWAPPSPRTSSEVTYGRKEEPTLVAAKPAHCKAKIGDLVDRMDDLRQALVAGLDYSEYVLRVQAIRAAYEAVPVDRLGLDCVAGPAGDAEDAFNQYLRAANLWGECAGTAGCAAGSIESRLQHRWKLASKSLDAAKRS